MSISAIALSPTTAGILNPVSPGSSQAGEAPFGEMLRSALNGVDRLEDQASTAVEGLLRGTGVDVHDAMIATQKAEMGFELALAVRNKAVAAYQQVMNMQF